MPRGQNRISEEDAVAMAKQAGVEPIESYPGMATKWTCICLRCGEKVTPTLQNMRKGFSGCKHCGAKARAANNTLTDEHMAPIYEAAGLEPLEPHVSALSLRRFRHAPCGREVTTRWNNVQQGAWHCPFCKAGNRIEGHEERLQKYGWTILEWISSRYVRARHNDCGYVHERLDIQSPGRCSSGCVNCSLSGFRPTMPAHLYFIEFPTYKAIKVGIANDLQQRLIQHAKRSDIRLLASFAASGRLVQAAERTILAEWRSAGVDPVSSMKGVPGYMETALAADVDLDALLLHAESLLSDDTLGTFDPSLWHVDEVDYVSARKFIRAHHYMGKLPSGLILHALKGHNQEMVGIAAYGEPSYDKVAASVYPPNPGGLIELRRLALSDQLGRNAESWFIAHSMKKLPTSVEVVLAFSDPSAGHDGTVYKAANFIYSGETAPSYHYLLPTSESDHKRNVWGRARRAGLTESAYAELHGLARVDDPPKFRFVYPRTRTARKFFQARATSNSAF